MARTIRNCPCGKTTDHMSHPETYKAWDRAEAKGDRKSVRSALTQMVGRDDSDSDFFPRPNR